MNKLFLIFLGLALLSVSVCKADESGKTFRIAILTPITHPSLEAIEKGFKETLLEESEATFRFKTFNAGGSKSLMRGEIEEIAKGQYDLLLTIGAQTTKMAKEVFEKKKLDTPIVFSAVVNPQQMHLVEGDVYSGNQLTGSIEVSDYQKLFTHLPKLNREINTLLVVYDPTQWMMEAYKEQIAKMCAEKGITLKTIEIFQTNELLAKTSQAIAQSDAVITLKDNTVIGGLDVLLKLARRNHIPLITSDLDSFAKGATMAFGVNECDYGAASAESAKKILFAGQSPGQIPLVCVTNFQLLLEEQK